MTEFFILFGVILLSTVAGYVSRRTGLLKESVATHFMTAVATAGYPPITLLTIWVTPLVGHVMWLPIIAVLQMLLMAAIANPIGRRLTKDPAEVGLFTIISSINNCGLTMGGFVIFLVLKDETALGLANLYCLTFTPMVVLLAYPIARHYAGAHPPVPLGRLLLRSIFDWRSIGLPVSLAGMVLSLMHVARPKFVDDWQLVRVLMYWLNFTAYFAIGMRLKFSYIRPTFKLIVGSAFTRFIVSAGVGVTLVKLTGLTPWPLVGVAASVVLIQSFVSTAVSNVAVANMFDLKPREASAIFVANTLLYVALVLPVVALLFA